MEDLNDKVANGGVNAAGKLASTDWNQVASEVQSVIESTGQALSGADLTQLGDAISSLAQGDAYFGTDTGSNIAYVVSAVNTVHPGVGLFTGQHVRFRPANTSTTTNPTLNAYGGGVRNIIAESGAAIAIGELATTRDAELRYDGTSWRLLDRSTALRPVGTYPKGHIQGLLLSNSVIDRDRVVGVEAGACCSSDGTANLDLGPFDKHWDQAWSTTTGGRPTALLGAQGFMRFFAIGGPTVTANCGFDNDINATNLLNDAGPSFTKHRQIGWVQVNSSNNVNRFFISPGNRDYYQWGFISSFFDNTTANGTRTLNVKAPPNTMAHFTCAMEYTIQTLPMSTAICFRHPSANTVIPIHAQEAGHMFWSCNLSFDAADFQTIGVQQSYIVGVDAASSFRMTVDSNQQNLVNLKMLSSGFYYDRERG